MGFLSRFGVGGPTVDLVLDTPQTTPGALLTGTLNMTGGKDAAEIEQVKVMLESVVEVERGDEEWRETVTFATQPVSGPMTLQANQPFQARVSLQVPWEAPITTVGGWQLKGMQVSVRTQVDIKGAVDPKDRDPVQITPLPVQQAILDGLASRGWRFKGADLEKGRLPGSTLPFYQELEFVPSGYGGRIRELEVTFLADPQQVQVVLEADRRGGFLSAGGDALARFGVPHHAIDAHMIGNALQEQISRLEGRGW
ncbi:sporulation protein [Nocardioides sp.]|uniref:sporulation protein n=1 Tax=Nocardioides sp. TaxID=35761 RepID=UPI0035119CA3